MKLETLLKTIEEMAKRYSDEAKKDGCTWESIYKIQALEEIVIEITKETKDTNAYEMCMKLSDYGFELMKTL